MNVMQVHYILDGQLLRTPGAADIDRSAIFDARSILRDCIINMLPRGRPLAAAGSNLGEPQPSHSAVPFGEVVSRDMSRTIR